MLEGVVELLRGVEGFAESVLHVQPNVCFISSYAVEYNPLPLFSLYFLYVIILVFILLLCLCNENMLYLVDMCHLIKDLITKRKQNLNFSVSIVYCIVFTWVLSLCCIVVVPPVTVNAVMLYCCVVPPAVH